MKRNVIVIMAAVLLVAGCYSFNTYEFKTMSSNTVLKSKSDGKQTSMANIIPISSATAAPMIKKCNAFQLPSLPITPPLPYDELAKVSVEDPDAIDRIQQKHIEELRDYIVKMKQAMIQAQKEHTITCN